MPKASAKPLSEAAHSRPPRVATPKVPGGEQRAFAAWLKDFNRRLDEAHRRADELLARLA